MSSTAVAAASIALALFAPHVDAWQLACRPSHAGAWEWKQSWRRCGAAFMRDEMSNEEEMLQAGDLTGETGIEMRRPVLIDVRRAFALVFNARTDNEGIYARRRGEDGADMILTFEERDDAERYAGQLEAQDFPEATPVEMDMRMLFEFCDEGGHDVGLVRAGSLVVPPKANVPKFDWSPGESAEGSAPPEDMTADELEQRRRALEALLP